MRVDQMMGAPIRRLLALLLILAATVGGAYVGWHRATDTYQSSGAVLIVPATIQTDADGAAPDNPLTRLDDNISQLALVVGSQLSSDAVRDRVRAVGGDVTYTADTRSGDDSAGAQLSPLVTITATSATASGAQRAIAVLLGQAGTRLAAIQSAAEVPVEAQARTVVSTPATAGTAMGHPQLWSAGVLGAAGGLVMLVVVLVGRSLLGGQPSRAASSQASAARIAPRSGAMAVRERQRQHHRPDPDDEGRFAPPSHRPSERPFATTASDPVSEVALPGTRRRQEVLREMVRDDWQRSGSNVPWTRQEHREAYQRAEDRLVELEHRRHGFEVESVDRFDDFLEHREHG